MAKMFQKHAEVVERGSLTHWWPPQCTQHGEDVQKHAEVEVKRGSSHSLVVTTMKRPVYPLPSLAKMFKSMLK
jgi:hypothetical protein